MVMRSVCRQTCGVCFISFYSKEEMEEHTAATHGKNWPPGMLERATDQMEFEPCMSTTPWGRDLR